MTKMAYESARQAPRSPHRRRRRRRRRNSHYGVLFALIILIIAVIFLRCAGDPFDCRKRSQQQQRAGVSGGQHECI